MAVTTTTNRIDYVGDGVSTVFTYPFLVYDATHMVAIKALANGTAVTLAQPTDYTVSGVGDPAGGTVTLVSPLLSGERLTLLRVVPLVQAAQYPIGSKFPSSTHERALDLLTMIAQQTAETFGRALTLTIGSTQKDKTIDDLVGGKGLRVKSDASGIEMVDLASTGNIALPLLPADGGTGADNATGAKGDLLVRTDAGVFTRHPGGADKTLLRSATAAPNGLEYVTPATLVDDSILPELQTRTVGASGVNLVAGGVAFSQDTGTDPTVTGMVQRNGTKLKFYDGAQVWTLNQLATGGYAVRGLVGQNDPAAPNTKYQLSANLVQLRSPADGSIAVRVNTGTITNDIGVAGPAPNGRDQSAAFPASSWIHFYFIWDGTTLATLSSLTGPPAGPTLPSGYTHWAYAGTVLYNSTPVLARTRMRGATVWYDAHQPVLVNGGATTETTIGIGGFVPPNALTVTVFGRARMNTNANGGNISAVWLRVVSGTTYAELEVLAQFGNDSSMNSSEVTLPQVGQSVIYVWGNDSSPANVSFRHLSLWVKGYTVPNGGE